MANKYNIPYVSIANGRVVYRPRITQEFKDLNLDQDSRGFLKPPRKLGRQGDSQDKIMKSYIRVKEGLKEQNRVNKCKLGYISEQYLLSSDFDRLKRKTQIEHKGNAKRILSWPIKLNKQPTTLSELDINNLDKVLMNALREAELKKYQDAGKKGTAAINRQVSYLSGAITWGLNYIPELPKIAHPLENIKKFKEEGNKRYVTDSELKAQYQFASEIRDYLPIVIRLSYLLGCRGIETINLKHSDLLEEGVDVSRTKGSKSNVIKWSDALRKEVAKAKALTRNTSSTPIDPYLVTNLRGLQISQSAIQKAMRQLRELMINKGMESEFFTLHKTKSKAQSDSDDDDISGLTESMKKHYTTKKKLIKTGLK